MRIDQARDERLAVAIHRPGGFVLTFELSRLSDGHDHLSFNGDGAVGDDSECGVHGDHGGVSEQYVGVGHT